MNPVCPTCHEPRVRGDRGARHVGPVGFCSEACMVGWYEDPRHDRRRQSQDVLINRRVRTLATPD
jgi:hypothetical protein